MATAACTACCASRCSGARPRSGFYPADSVPCTSSWGDLTQRRALLARADGSAWNKDAWKYPFKGAVTAAELPAAATAYALRHLTITDLIALHKLNTLTVAQL